MLVSALKHERGGCEGSVDTEVCFLCHKLSFCQVSMRPQARGCPAEPYRARLSRHTRRQRQAMPGSDVGGATCA